MQLTLNFVDGTNVTDTVIWEVPTAAPSRSLDVSPPSGPLTTTQAFDLAIFVGTGGLGILNGLAAFDGRDVTGVLLACLVTEPLPGGGVVFRCPGLSGAALGAGPHTFRVDVNLSDGSALTRMVTWEVRPASEP